MPMPTISRPTLIEGRYGPVSRAVIESQRASQLRAIQELRRKVGATGLRIAAPSTHPAVGPP